MHYYLWHNKEQSGTLCSSPMSPSSQATTPGFINSHGGGSDITSGQKSAQRGCMEAIKWFFWAQNLAVPKSCGKNQLKPFGAKKNLSGTRKYEGFGCPQLYMHWNQTAHGVMWQVWLNGRFLKQNAPDVMVQLHITFFLNPKVVLMQCTIYRWE